MISNARLCRKRTHQLPTPPKEKQGQERTHLLLTAATLSAWSQLSNSAVSSSLSTTSRRRKAVRMRLSPHQPEWILFGSSASGAPPK